MQWGALSLYMPPTFPQGHIFSLAPCVQCPFVLKHEIINHSFYLLLTVHMLVTNMRPTSYEALNGFLYVLCHKYTENLQNLG
jgi:hypothetical protein